MKGDSISFSFEASMKGQALGDPFKFKESENIKQPHGLKNNQGTQSNGQQAKSNRVCDRG